MATCDYCGERVTFRPLGIGTDGRPVWSPPMDIFAERHDARTGEDGLMRIVTTTELVQHHCAKRTAEEAAHAAAREAEAARQRQLFAKGESYEQLLERAAQRDCPRCGVKAGETCENLQKRRQGVKVLNRTPHQERVQYRG